MTVASKIPAAERRHYARIAFHAPAQLVLASGALDVVVLDLSLKGALVQVPENALDLGAETDPPCELNIDLDDAESDRICMKVRIAHAHQGRIGLLCQDIDLDSVTHLRRLVELNLGNPDLLERELSALIAD